ncbi:MAG TPA: RsmG family class I SAM-dependent methyltransferase [Gaiellaceae bacterium]
MGDERLDRWLVALVDTPGLTAVSDPDEARRLHLDAALEAAPLIEGGPVVDVGSGGGSPGLPLAAARPDLRFDLLESARKKCEFLTRWTSEFENASVVCARAEEHARGPGRDAYRTALARALAPPSVAAEWCLPLVAPGGRAILFVGPSVDEAAAGRAAAALAAEIEDSPAGFLLLRKTGPTPERFPRRPGIARKRPLA